MEGMFLPFFILIAGSILGGSWGLGMKYMKPLAHEAWWLIFSLFSLIITPVIWASLAVPDLWGSIFATPSEALIATFLMGIFWGIGNILFGYCVRYIGVSLTYGIVMGLSGLTGSVVPIFMMPDVGGSPAIPFVVLGVIIMLTGITIVGCAGLRRDRIMAEKGMEIAGIGKGRMMRIGIAFAVACGLVGSLMNIGFARGLPIAVEAAERGALNHNSSLAVWVVLYCGGFITNAGYAIFMMFRNRSWGTYNNPVFSRGYIAAVLTGIAFFACAGIYGQAVVMLGSIGPVIGWPVGLSATVIVSNLWGKWTGEWKGAPGPFRQVWISIAVFILAMATLAYANTLF